MKIVSKLQLSHSNRISIIFGDQGEDEADCFYRVVKWIDGVERVDFRKLFPEYILGKAFNIANQLVYSGSD